MLEDTFSNSLLAKGEGTPQSEARAGCGPEEQTGGRLSWPSEKDTHWGSGKEWSWLWAKAQTEFRVETLW